MVQNYGQYVRDLLQGYLQPNPYTYRTGFENMAKYGINLENAKKDLLNAYQYGRNYLQSIPYQYNLGSQYPMD